jgi:NADH-quinone oxidoreductase subunit J
MDFTTVLFYAFSVVLVLAGLLVITAKNPVHAALFLVLAFFNAAGLWMLLKAEFLAIVLVLVYVGAVMVLFLFVVMMLDINIDRMRKGFWGYLPVASGVGALIVLEMATVLWRGFLGQGDAPAESAVGHIGGTRELGRLIYTQYIYGFEIAGLILLVAIIAAVALTLRKRKDTKAIDPGLAVRVKRNDRLKIIKVPVVNQKAIDDAAIAAAAAAQATTKEAQ